jgi:hypothetical protein
VAAAAKPKTDGPSKVTYKVKQRLEVAEKAVEAARLALEVLDRELADAETFAHKADAGAKFKARAKLQKQLDAAEAEWLAALEALEPPA